MIAAVLEESVVVNLIVVTSIEDVPGAIDGTGATIGDTWDGEKFLTPDEPLPPPTVPAKVTRRQARQALLLGGLLDQVIATIAAIEDPVERRMAQIEWEDAQEFERTRPLVLQMGAALNLDLDALFIHAAAL